MILNLGVIADEYILDQLLQRTSLTPLGITLTTYNRRIRAVTDLEALLIFRTVGGNSAFSRQEAGAIAAGFKKAFIRYLHGVGHVNGMESTHVTPHEYHQRRSDPLLCTNITLHHIMSSWLLSIGATKQDKINVRCPARLFLACF